MRARDHPLQMLLRRSPLPSALAESEERRARFRQEARIAAALRHPGIVQIYDFGEAAGTMYLIMEYIDGESLKARMTRLRTSAETMTVEAAVDIAGQLARALAYTHGQGAVPWPSNLTIASAVLKSWQTPSPQLRPQAANLDGPAPRPGRRSSSPRASPALRASPRAWGGPEVVGLRERLGAASPPRAGRTEGGRSQDKK